MYKKHLVSFSVLVLVLALVFSCKKEVAPSSTGEATLSEQVATRMNPPTATTSVFATGLNNPRGLEFGPDGNLYVAEAGLGGGTHSTVGTSCQQVPAPVGPYKGNPTGGRVSKVDMNGVRTTVTTQIPTANNALGDIVGAADVAFLGNTLYALVTAGGCSHGLPDNPSGVYKVNSNGTTWLVADLSAYQRANPVANPEPDDFEPDGSWYSMNNVNGTLYALEANHGEMVKIGTNGSVSRVVDISATQGHIVPTVFDYRGNFYVGNLNTFPIMGDSKIFKVTPSGNLQMVADSLSTVLGIAIGKTSWIYVLENTAGHPFPTPFSGKIIAISPSGQKSTLVSGLSFPTGLTMGPDGNLYVSNWGFGKPPGGGEVVKVTVQ
ncbi:MAG: ScyD/ScyE family protein [Flavisolibacter sp.]